MKVTSVKSITPAFKAQGEETRSFGYEENGTRYSFEMTESGAVKVRTANAGEIRTEVGPQTFIDLRKVDGGAIIERYTPTGKTVKLSITDKGFKEITEAAKNKKGLLALASAIFRR